jgi:hypothetical protein
LINPWVRLHRSETALLIFVLLATFAFEKLWLSWLLVFFILFLGIRSQLSSTTSFVLSLCLMWLSQLVCFILAYTTSSDLRVWIFVTFFSILALSRISFLSINDFSKIIFRSRNTAFLIAPTSWLLVQIMATTRHEYAALTWAMSGDTRNNAIFINGLKLGQIEVTPLTLLSGGFTGISASTLSANSGQVASGFSQQSLEIIAYDIRNSWMFLICIVSILAGVLTSKLLQNEIQIVRSVSVIFATLTIFSWSFLGRALEGGFLNSFLALALILCSFVLWTERTLGGLGEKLYVAGQSLIFALMVATWAPVSVIQFGFLVVPLAKWIASLLTKSPQAWKIGLFPISVMMIILVFREMIESDLRMTIGKILRTDGGFYPFGHGTLMILILLVFFILVISDINQVPIIEMITALVGAALMLVAILWSRRELDVQWGYYPLKFAWIVSMALFILLIGLVGRAIQKSDKGIALKLLTTLVSLVCIFQALKFEAKNLPGANSPVSRVLNGWSAPDGLVIKKLFESPEFNSPNSFFYKFSDRESDRLGNFWAALLSTNPSEAVHWAYLYDSTDTESFCQITFSQPNVNIVTLDPSVKNEMIRYCQIDNFEVLVQ